MPAEYVCACGKRFRRREHLNRHAQAHHSSSRPHVCGICQRAFARSDVLKRHVAHHRETGTSRLLRASSACDRCHARKERCSGELPCTRCVESGSLCQKTRLSPTRGGASSSAAAVQPPSPQGTSFFRDSSSSSSGSGSENEAPMVHSPQARCEDAVDDKDDDDERLSISPPPSYTATPSPYTRPQKDTREYHARQQQQQQQQALQQQPHHHHHQQGRPSSTVLNLISAAAAYKSIITGLDSTGTGTGTGAETNNTDASTPTPPQPPAAPITAIATTTAMVPAATILHTPPAATAAAAPIIPSPSYFAETSHPYPQTAHPSPAYFAETSHPYPQTAHSSPSPPINSYRHHHHQQQPLHAPQPLRPLRSVRQLEPPPPQQQQQPQPQPMNPLTNPTTAPHAYAQLTSSRLAAARLASSHPTILAPHPFIRALAARLVSPELVELYFADFHYCWPLLHRGRFLERLDEQPVELVWSVGLIGSLFLDGGGAGGRGPASSAASPSSGGSSSPWGPAGSPGSVRGSVMTRRDEEERSRSRQQQQRWGERGGDQYRGGSGRSGGTDERDTFRNAAKEVHEWLLTNLSAHLNQWRVEDSYPGDEVSQANFVVAQALLLNIIYAICTDQTSLRLRTSSSLSTLIEWIREAGLFQSDRILDRHESVSSSSSSCSSGIGQGSDTDYERWLELESRKRLSMSIFRLDIHLSIFHDRAPSIRFQEVRVPLQCTLALWDAYTVEDWRRARLLEPNGRLHKTFSSICATAASANTRQTIPVLLEEDFELGLCAMQARLWEDTQQRHEEFGNSSDAYDFGPTRGNGGGGRGGIVREGRVVGGHEVGPNDLIAQEFVGFGEGWHAQLEHWRVHRERCQQVNTGYAPPAHWRRTRFNTSMLYFLSYVRMHADVVLIRRLSASLQREQNGRLTPASMSSMSNRRLENRVHAWAGSRNARIAVRYAAQMFRLYAEEVDMFASSFQRIDPFSVGCMLRAGLVVWAYTRSNLICELCSDLSPDNTEDPGMSSPFFGPQVVCELAEIWGPVDSEYVNYWILNGGKASMNGNLLCACGLQQLIDAFSIVMRRGTIDSTFVEPVIRMLENLKYCR